VRWLQVRQTRRYLSRALVVFACSPADAKAIDIALGPCQPRFGPKGGRLRPYALPSSQSYSTTFEHLARLFSILTDHPPPDAVTDIRKAGPGTMGRLTYDFIEVLATVRVTSLAALHDGGKPFQLENDISQHWIHESRWPSSMQVGGLAMRIFMWSVECEKAIEKDLNVFCWEGPAVPEYVIAHGVGPESYEAYRKARGS
jgi:hypothetical protein